MAVSPVVALLILVLHRPERLQIQPMISHGPLSTCPTYQPVPSTG
jgi:hypothetical protein